MQTEAATVYRALTGRRYFTPYAALKRDAYHLMNAKYDLVEADNFEEFQRRVGVAHRYARMKLHALRTKAEG